MIPLQEQQRRTCQSTRLSSVQPTRPPPLSASVGTSTIPGSTTSKGRGRGRPVGSNSRSKGKGTDRSSQRIGPRDISEGLSSTQPPLFQDAPGLSHDADLDNINPNKEPDIPSFAAEERVAPRSGVEARTSRPPCQEVDKDAEITHLHRHMEQMERQKVSAYLRTLFPYVLTHNLSVYLNNHRVFWLPIKRRKRGHSGSCQIQKYCKTICRGMCFFKKISSLSKSSRQQGIERIPRQARSHFVSI